MIPCSCEALKLHEIDHLTGTVYRPVPFYHRTNLSINHEGVEVDMNDTKEQLTPSKVTRKLTSSLVAQR